MRTLRILSTILVITAMAGCASTGGEGTGERFRGNLAAMGGPGAGGTAMLDLQADRYASDAEVEALARALVDGGEKGLYEAVQAIEPMGWIRLGGNTRYDLRLVRSVPTPDGGRIIRAVTDREIHFLEVIRPLRSRDYPYGIIQLELDPSGKGSGFILAAAQITFEDDTIEIETLGNQPYRVINASQMR